MAEQVTSEKSFPIVGIGASAGGLDALQSFLSVLPQDFGFALVFIQHLSSKHKSLLPELLAARRPSLVIQEISDGLKALPGRLYLAPPGKEVRIRNGFFQLTVHPEGLIHLPIDEFLSSLAQDADGRSIAVIFSGAGTDGARGCQAIRTAGGTVFVQDPETAEFSSMPIAAIATGQADAVLSPEDICRELLKIQGIGAAVVSREYPVTPEEFDSFFRLLREKTGSRFNHYKKSVISRRIRRRMYLHDISAIKDYLALILSDDAEAAHIASDLMIGVTSFFRDRVAWKALNLEAIRKIAAEKTDLPVRVWTPASATGEEAYSIAMMLMRELAGKKRDVQVFATDVNDRALERAREGKYPASITADVPQEFIQKFFTSAEDGNFLVINKEVRECVVFAKQDLLIDPPFSKLDLIICRNFMIYLEPEAQDKCIRLFHYALNNGGYLFLGSAETVGRKSALFQSLGRKQCRVYRKLETKSASRLPISVPYATERQAPPAKQSQMTEQGRPIVEIIQEKLLEEYGPASVAIDQNYEIIYHNGPTNSYLHQPRGVPTQNLLELLPTSLRSRIRGALYRSGREEKPVAIRTSVSGADNRKRQVSLRITKAAENLYIVVFQENRAPSKKEAAEQINAAVIEETAIHQLESELAATRADLQSHIEQLKSLNEELQSSNEELQAANEELETSREELQSLNEELITVNSQLQAKIEEQDETNNDLNNFLANTNIPTIFLDTHFRVKRFTPAMLRLIKLLPSDVGRPIVDMSQDNLGPDIISDAEYVLEQLMPMRRELELSGAWYVRTTLPYRTADNRIEGVVVTYNDVSELKMAEERTRHLASFPQFNPSPVLEVNSTGSIIYSNAAVQRVLESLSLNKDDITVFLPHDIDDILGNLNKNIEETLTREFTFADKVFEETIYVAPRFSAVRIYAFDITERKRAEEALQESEQRVRLKLNSILSPEGDIGTLELGDIIDAPAIQSLMEKFYELTQIPLAVIDLKGKVLVGMGWQEICTKFHRVHPEACGYCIESDTLLTEDVPAGEYKLYKCKNNMWDVATAIVVGGRTLGHFFTGQFLFDDERPDYEFFRAQAKQYGFAEKEYLAALDKVPRLSRATVDRVMGFFMKLSAMVSQLSYSNIKLARSLAERDALMDSLRKSQQQNEFLADIVRHAAQPFGQGFPDGRLGLINKAFEQLTGYSEDELRSMDWARVLTPPEWNAFEQQKLEELHRTGKPVRYEKEYIRKDGTRVPIELLVHLVADPDGKPLYYYSFLTDITERNRADEELQATVKRFYAILSSLYNGIMLVSDEDRVEYVNQAFLNMFTLSSSPPDLMGLTSQEMIDKIRGVYLHADEAIARIQDIVRRGQPVKGEEVALQGGRTYVRDFIPLHVEGKSYGRLWYQLDITERKRAEETLRQSEKQYRELFENMIEGFAYCKMIFENGKPQDFIYLSVNQAFETLTGFTNVVGKRVTEFIPGIREADPEIFEIYGRVSLTGRPERFEIFVEALKMWFSISVYSPEKEFFVAVFDVITERKRAEEAQLRLNKALKALSDSSQAIIRTKDEPEYLNNVCRIIVEDCGYSMAWIGFAENDDARSIRPAAYSGFEEGYLETLQLTWADTERGRGPTGTAIRTGDVAACRNMLTDPAFAPWRKEAIKRGYASSIVFPLRVDGGVFGAISIYSKEADPFTENEVRLLTELTDNVAYGIEVLRIRATQNQAEDALRRSEEKYRSLFENMIDGLAYHRIVVDENGKPVDYIFLEVNESFEKQTGLKRADIIGKSVREALPGIENDPADWIGTYGNVALTGQEARFQHYAAPLGKWYSVSAYSPMKGFFVAIFEDVTESKKAEDALRESEERFRSMFERHQAVMLLVEPESGTIVDANAAASRYYGYPPERLRAMRIQDINQLMPENIAAERKAAAEEKRNYFVFPHVLADGRLRWVEVYSTPFEAQGRPLLFSVIHDVTDRKVAEADLLKLSEDMAARNLELESANKEMESFVYSISHDLRAPIRSVSGFAKIIVEDYLDKLDAQGRDYLNRILKGAEKSTQLIDDLLHLSKIARQDMERIKVDLSGKASKIVEELREMNCGRNIEVVVQEGLTASADPRLIELALSNLLGNAWKFTSKTENARIEFGKLDCGVRSADCGIKSEIANPKSEIEKTVYFIKDNGAGFDLAYADKMFWPFHRLHLENEFEGTGIGLTIVERVIRRHGGRVWAEGEVGKGATIYFTLG